MSKPEPDPYVARIDLATARETIAYIAADVGAMSGGERVASHLANALAELAQLEQRGVRPVRDAPERLTWRHFWR